MGNYHGNKGLNGFSMGVTNNLLTGMILQAPLQNCFCKVTFHLLPHNITQSLTFSLLFGFQYNTYIIHIYTYYVIYKYMQKEHSTNRKTNTQSPKRSSCVANLGQPWPVKSLHKNDLPGATTPTRDEATGLGRVERCAAEGTEGIWKPPIKPKLLKSKQRSFIIRQVRKQKGGKGDIIYKLVLCWCFLFQTTKIW